MADDPQGGFSKTCADQRQTRRLSLHRGREQSAAHDCCSRSRQLLERRSKGERNSYTNSRPLDVHKISQHQAERRQDDACVSRSAPFHNAIEFDRWITSSHDDVHRLVTQVFEEIQWKPKYYPQRQRSQEKLEVHIQAVVLNLFMPWRTDPTQYVRYSRNKTDYPGTPLSADTLLLRVLKALEDYDYIVDYPAAPQPDGGEQSRMKWTEKLGALFLECGITSAMIKSERPLLVFKGKKPEPEYRGHKPRAPIIPLPNTPQLRPLRAGFEMNLRKINEILDRSFVGLFVPNDKLRELNQGSANGSEEDDEEEDQGRNQPIDFRKKRLYRIFNDIDPTNPTLDKHGRFYGGWWQHIPRWYRKNRIWINEERGVETDFSNMHPVILYAQHGLEIDDYNRNPYSLRGIDSTHEIRKVIKRTFIIMLNNDSRPAAVAATEGALREKYRVPKGGSLNEHLPNGCPTVAEIVDQITKDNPKVRIFGKEAGLQRMFTESQIAEHVMLALIDMGIPVLPIHDSFIAPASNHYDVGIAMWNAFEAVTEIPSARESLTVDSIFTPRELLEEMGKEEDYPVDWEEWPWDVDENEYSIFFNLARDSGWYEQLFDHAAD